MILRKMNEHGFTEGSVCVHMLERLQWSSLSNREREETD